MTSLTTQDRIVTASTVSGRRLALGVAVALVLNLAVYLLGTAAGATWVANGQPIGWVMVALATVLPFAIGGLITWRLARRWAAAPRRMAWIGLAFALVTLPMPFLASSDLTTSLSLASMHAITGIAWFLSVIPRAASTQA